MVVLDGGAPTEVAFAGKEVSNPVEKKRTKKEQWVA